jgi:hypothetical protein
VKSEAPAPRLTDAIARDEQRLAAVIDALLVPDPAMRRHRRQILRRQHDLHRLCAEQAWQAYLKLEEASNLRLDAALLLVARWGFNEGRRRR